MAVTRNAKKKDFDYYLTNLDWDDGSPIERDIKQFTRNDVFEHTYEKPGFYSIKGLAFKFERVMVEISPPMNENMALDWEDVTPSNSPTGYSQVKSQQRILELSSSLSDFTLRSGDEDDEWIIKDRFGGDNDVKLVTDANRLSLGLLPDWINSVIAPIEKRTEGRTPGIGIEIPINMDISNIDVIYYSFELNLANPNGEDSPSQYQIHERSYPPTITSTGSLEDDASDDTIATDWGARFDSVRYVDGVGGNSTDPNRGNDVKDGGWRTFSGYIFVQEPESIASNGSNISELPYQINFSKIEISPRYPDDTPQDENVTAYIGLRNLTIRIPNTENIIRPNEWQRFYSNMIVNPKNNYQSPLYELNNFGMIGGVSEKSAHFKTLASLTAFDLDDKEFRNNSLISSYNPYDFIAIYDTMAKYNADYYNEVLDPYTNPIHEDYAPYWKNTNGEDESLFDKKRIFNGIIDTELHGVLKDTEIIDIDIGVTKFHKGVVSMREHLGLGEENNIPNEQIYWKNIIPKDYKLTNRSGFSQEPLEDPSEGSITPRVPRLVWVIDEENDQFWNDGYYWPNLPKMTEGGVFTEPIDLNQYGNGNIVSNDPIDDTLFNLTFDVDDVEELKDITDNYNIEYRVDGLLDLDENNRVELITEDVTDTLEKDFNRQAF